jgi:beta-lactamase regulating signal transducer with metallopeptidase domain
VGFLTEIRWLSLFGEFLIKSTLALCLALAVVALFRKRPASVRHFVLSLFLVGLFFLPIFQSFPVGWETRLLPPRTAGSANLPQLLSKGSLENGRLPSAAAINPDRPGNAASGQPVGLAPAAKSRSVSEAGTRWGTLALGIWSAGLFFLIARLALGLFGAHRLTRESEDIGGSIWRVLLHRALAAIGLKRNVRLKCHKKIAVPLTWGLFRPVVLIPADHERWTEDQRSSALFHELSHIKRGDFLIMMLVRLSLAVFWLNPLGWFVFRQLKKEQEQACDDLVLRTGLKPSVYAANLLRFRGSEGVRWNPSAAFLGLFHKSSFNERLSAILKQRLTFQEVKMKTRVILSFMVILAVAFIGMARPASAPAKKEAVPASHAISIGESEICPPAESALSGEDRIPQEKAEAQEKQGEKKKEEKSIIVVKPKEEKTAPLEITIIKGDETKTLTFGKPITIQKSADGTIIILSPEGNELEVLKGGPVRLEIKSGGLELIKEGKAIKITEGRISRYRLVTKKEKAGAALSIVLAPAVKIHKPGTEKKKNIQIVVEPRQGAKPTIGLVAENELSEIREKARRIRETLRKVKEEKLDIAELEKELGELEAELKKSESTSRLEIKVAEKPSAFTVIRKKSDQEAGTEVSVEKEPGERKFTVISKKEGGFTIVYGTKAAEKSREAYERTVERVKKELPEGYSLEPEFNEKAGIITLKIQAAGAKVASEDLVRKIVDILKEELKKEETKK